MFAELPDGPHRAEYMLVNEAAYPWHGLANVKLEHDSDAVTIATAGRLFRYRVVAQAGSRLLLHQSDESAWLDGGATWR